MQPYETNELQVSQAAFGETKRFDVYYYETVPAARV